MRGHSLCDRELGGSGFLQSDINSAFVNSNLQVLIFFTSHCKLCMCVMTFLYCSLPRDGRCLSNVTT